MRSYLPAFLLFFLVLPLGVWTVHHAETSQPPGIRFLVPGETTVTLDRPGSYLLWHEFESVYQGKPYFVNGTSPPEMKITLRPAAPPDAPELPLAPTWTRAESGPNFRRLTWGRYEAPAPGNYLVQAPGSYPPRVMLLRPASDFLFSLQYLLGFLLTLAGTAGAAALALRAYASRLPPAEIPD